MKGALHDEDQARATKLYVWHQMGAAFGGRIVPSDIDAIVEHRGCFFIFEGKTRGVPITTGQEILLTEMLRQHGPGHAVVVVGEHPKLDTVRLPGDVLEVRYRWHDGMRLRKSPTDTHPAALFELASLFYEDAHTDGRLRCDTWAQRLHHNRRPFEEAS